MMLVEIWRPIAEAATDGTPVVLYIPASDDLPAFQCVQGYHPDAGWCVDALREATHFTPQLPEPGKERLPLPTHLRDEIDNLTLSQPGMEALLWKDHPPASASPAEALSHFGDNHTAWGLWVHWRAGARLLAGLDAWVKELMPAPSGGRAHTRD